MAFISRKQQQAMGIVQGEPRRFETAAPAQQAAPDSMPPQTALAPVQPIAPRALLDSHNRLIDVYAQQAREAARVTVMPPDTERDSTRGHSSSSELQARNARFYFTVGALVIVNAVAAWGLVSTANIAALIGDVWTIPLWLSLTGIAAFVTIQHVHAGEQRLTPENIELVRAENEFAIQHMDAETRQMAIRLAAQNDRERLQLERERNEVQRQQAMMQTLEVKRQIGQQMARHTAPQSTMNRVNNYRAPVAYVAPQSAQNALETPVDSMVAWYSQDAEIDAPSAVLGVEQQLEPDAPIVDPVRLALLNFAADLFLDRDSNGVYRRMDSDGKLAKGIIAPWSKRGGFNAAQRQQAQEILRQCSPWLFRYDDTAKCWVANLQHYKRAVDVVSAIDAAYTPRVTWE